MNEVIEKKLQELELTQKQFWNIDRGTANLLSILIKSANYRNIVEVGTSNGYSGIWLGLAAEEIGGKVITIEFHKCRYDVAAENFEICGLNGIVEPRQGMAIDELIDLKKEDYNSKDEKFLDFAFVDANKQQYIKYFEIIDEKLRKGGMIAFDNMLSHKEKVQDTLERLQNDDNYQIQMINTPAGLLLAYKLN